MRAFLVFFCIFQFFSASDAVWMPLLHFQCFSFLSLGWICMYSEFCNAEPRSCWKSNLMNLKIHEDQWESTHSPSHPWNTHSSLHLCGFSRSITVKFMTACSAHANVLCCRDDLDFSQGSLNIHFIQSKWSNLLNPSLIFTDNPSSGLTGNRRRQDFYT